MDNSEEESSYEDSSMEVQKNSCCDAIGNWYDSKIYNIKAWWER